MGNEPDTPPPPATIDFAAVKARVGDAILALGDVKAEIEAEQRRLGGDVLEAEQAVASWWTRASVILAGAWHSITVRVNVGIVAIAEILPTVSDIVPQLQSFMPQRHWLHLVAGVAIANILLRGKTKAPLAGR